MTCTWCKKEVDNCKKVSPAPLPTRSAIKVKDSTDCGTCGWINTTWELENWYKAKLLEFIASDTLPTFDSDWNPTWCVKVSELPKWSRWMTDIGAGWTIEYIEYYYDKWISICICLNGDGVEQCVLTNIPWQPWKICILKRWIHPAATNLIVDWQWSNAIVVTTDWSQKEVAPDFNNCEFMFEHNPWETVERWVYAQEHAIFLQHTCCITATNTNLGITAISIPAENPEFPIAVWINDFVNCPLEDGTPIIWILAWLTKCVPEWQEIAVSWNDYATDTRAWLSYVSNIISIDCNTWNTTVETPNWDSPETALNALQHALPTVYGSVVLSRCNESSTAVAKNDNATCDNNGLVKLKPLKEWQLCPNIPTWISDCWDIDSATRVIQEFDYADSANFWLVQLATALTEEFPCPIVPTMRTFAAVWECGIISTRDQCGEDCQKAITECSYASDIRTGINYMSVDPTDCGKLTAHTPDNEHPIATSTEDKRNFNIYACAMVNYTDIWNNTAFFARFLDILSWVFSRKSTRDCFFFLLDIICFVSFAVNQDLSRTFLPLLLLSFLSPWYL